MERSYAAKKAPRDPLVGRVLHDRYRVERRIGKGGMGIVYLAEHVLLRRKVALKVLSERAFASEELVARFHREATAAAAVGNEHVVGVTDMGQLDDGTFFVVLEYLDGVELGHAIAEQGPFGVQRAVRLVLQLCDALAAVHAAGIVHRDLKPENLFLVERNGEPDFLKVLDFGVCKVLDVQRSGERSLTDTGVSLGRSSWRPSRSKTAPRSTSAPTSTRRARSCVEASEARAAVARAKALVAVENYGAALAEYTRALELLEGDPRQAAVLNNIAVCYERMFRYDLALQY